MDGGGMKDDGWLVATSAAASVAAAVFGTRLMCSIFARLSKYCNRLALRFESRDLGLQENIAREATLKHSKASTSACMQNLTQQRLLVKVLPPKPAAAACVVCDRRAAPKGWRENSLEWLQGALCGSI